MGLPGQRHDTSVYMRLAGIMFPPPGRDNLTLVIDVYAASDSIPAEAKPVKRLEIAYKPQPSQPYPPQDVIDRQTGVVIIAAGSQRPAMPTAAEILDRPSVLDGMTIRDLLDLAKSELYGAVQDTIPDWRYAKKV